MKNNKNMMKKNYMLIIKMNGKVGAIGLNDKFANEVAGKTMKKVNISLEII